MDFAELQALDYFVLLMVLMYLCLGAVAGFLLGTLRLVATLAALVAAVLLAEKVASPLDGIFFIEDENKLALGALVAMSVTHLLGRVVTGLFSLAKLAIGGALASVGHIVGGTIGLLRVVVLFLVMCVCLGHTEPEYYAQYWNDSQFAPQIGLTTQAVIKALPSVGYAKRLQEMEFTSIYYQPYFPQFPQHESEDEDENEDEVIIETSEDIDVSEALSPEVLDEI